jgi:hypothetical protein
MEVGNKRDHCLRMLAMMLGKASIEHSVKHPGKSAKHPDF